MASWKPTVQKELGVTMAASENTAEQLRCLDLDALARTPRNDNPFPHVIVPGFVSSAAGRAISADYPPIARAGSFPVGDLSFGAGFRGFLAELEGPEFRAAIVRKFDIDLAGRPTMITVRGQARARDGRIHNDSRTKL